MNIKAFIAVVMLTVASIFYTKAPVSANEVCFTQYGGGETCIETEDDAQIRVDKKVSDEDGNYNDHLKSSVHKFEAEDKVYFKINVENKGDVDLVDVELKDVLPDFLNYGKTIDGPSASVNGNEIKWDLGRLNVGESETVKFYAKVVDEKDLPTDDKVCLTNVARAEGEREDNGEEEKDADYANFCIELGDILGEEAPTKLPKAGNPITLAIFGVASLVAGLSYKRNLSK